LIFEKYFQRTKRTTTLEIAIFEQFVLVCFFESKLKSSAGCVTTRQQTSTDVKERQQTSMDAITILTTLQTAYRFLKK
jgi:hypothetical protein